jgi:hypothetical protein
VNKIANSSEYFQGTCLALIYFKAGTDANPGKCYSNIESTLFTGGACYMEEGVKGGSYSHCEFTVVTVEEVCIPNNLVETTVSVAPLIAWRRELEEKGI